MKNLGSKRKFEIPKLIRRISAFCLEQPLGAIGILLFLGLVVLAIGAPVWAPIGPTHTSISKAWLPPSSEFWFGTDNLGRDMWSRWVYGSRTSTFANKYYYTNL